MIKRRFENVITHINQVKFKYPFTNAAAEGFNSKVQAIKSSARVQAVKSSARGFRSFVKYRLRILFYCKNSPSYPTARATKFPEEP